MDKLIFEQTASTILPASPFSYSAIVNLDTTDPFFANTKLEALINAKERLTQYGEARLKAMDTWSQSDTGVKSWFEKLFQPSSTQGYTYGFTSDPMYRAWVVITKLADLWGTEPISGDPILDSAFDKDDPFRYAGHHKTPSNTLSMLLYDITLTDHDYHPNPIGSMSSSDLDIIENGLRRLYFIGLSRKSPINGKWVTESDFKNIFPDALKFKFRYNSIDHEASLYEIWKNILNEHYSFVEKLGYINAKIHMFKEAVQNGENPHLAVLEAFFPSAVERFLHPAGMFMEQFKRLIIYDLFTAHSAADLAHQWQIYMAQKIFDIQ